MSNEIKETVTELKSAKLIRLAEEEAELRVQLVKEELAAKAEEREVRRHQLKDLKSSIADRDLKDKQSQLDREQQGKTFRAADAQDQYNWRVCTHKKGGMASGRDMRVLHAGGNAAYYAVVKHQMLNGDIWVRCSRCSRTWAPPVEKNFYFRDGVAVARQDGVFDQAKFNKAQEEYFKALNFETNNTMSGSVQCRMTRKDPVSGKMVDAADVYRENIASSNLR
jgi:hypothetical protein